MSEQRTFVFAVTFIVVFSALIGSIPVDFQGTGGATDTLIPVNPNLLTDFSDSEDFVKSDFVELIYWYPETLGGYDFYCGFITDSFYVAAKSLFFGLWFGALSAVNFIYENGTTDYYGVSFADISNTAVDGIAPFTLVFQDSGNPAGSFLFYWNTTTYANPSDAWDADNLYLLHGVGMTANTDIATLLISLLFLQLPDVPLLVNILIVTPIWASIIFVLWFIIKEMIPFLG
jgi:hypothetical protein